MLGIWNTLLKGGAQSTWVFMGWEGVEAQRKGVELNAFYLEKFGVPYGPYPLLITKPETANGALGSRMSGRVRVCVQSTSRSASQSRRKKKACRGVKSPGEFELSAAHGWRCRNRATATAGPNADKIRAFLKATAEGYKARRREPEARAGRPPAGAVSAALSLCHLLSPAVTCCCESHSTTPANAPSPAPCPLQMAVADPVAAADAFTELATKENPDLPEPLDRDFVRDSVKWYVDNKVLLDESGNWGKISVERFGKWLDWLHSNSALR